MSLRPRSLLTSPLAAVLVLGACSAAPTPPAQGTASPSGTTPAPEGAAPLACASGAADCDGDRANACETRLDSSSQHCGACGTACDAAERCVRGACMRANPLVAENDTACVVIPRSPDAASSKATSVRCWGDAIGLGDGQSVRRSVPVELPHLAGAVSLRLTFTSMGCGLFSTGKVACWFGGDAPSPVRALSGAVDVGLNMLSETVCAVLGSGEVACVRDWSGASGEEPKARPVPGVRDALSIVSNSEYMCVLLRSGEVTCWDDPTAKGDEGAAPRGEGEDGEAASQPEIQRVGVAGLTGAVQIASASFRSCAVTKGGEVACWGSSRLAEIEERNAGDVYKAVRVEGLHDAVEVAVADFHACAVRKTGEVVCWGMGFNGELGAGAPTTSETPIPVVGLSDAIHVAAGDELSCAQRRSGAVSCWGSAEAGKLGNGQSAEHDRPVEVAGVGDAASVVASDSYTCAIGRGGAVTCWGRAPWASALGKPRARGVPPVAVPALDGPVSLQAGARDVCATKKSGEVVCARAGQPIPDETAKEPKAFRSTAVQGLGRASSVLATGAASVALLGPGKPVLWDGRWLQAALSPEGAKAPPRTAPIAGVADAVAFAGDKSTACLLRRSGRVSCLRYRPFDTFKRDGSTEPPGPLVEIPGLRDAVRLSFGGDQFCVVRKAGQVACFRAEAVPPPPGTKDPQRPLLVKETEGMKDAVMVAAGSGFHCALLKSGEVACAGRNYDGQLGQGDYEGHKGVVLVRDITDAVSVAAGRSHVCAALKSGRVTCWGSNKDDAAGHPDAPETYVPVAVKGLDR